jgi:hypothetical protein
VTTYGKGYLINLVRKVAIYFGKITTKEIKTLTKSRLSQMLKFAVYAAIP